MPCYTKRTGTLAMARADLDTMADALRSAGWSVSLTSDTLTAYDPAGSRLEWSRGQTEARVATWEGRDPVAVGNAAKRAYSQLLVTRTYGKAGIKVRATSTNAAGQTVLRLGR